MDKRNLLLIALSTAPRFSPVQIQKLIFLLQKNLPFLKDKEAFHFEPYHYGPFNKEIYTLLEELKKEELLAISEEKTSGLRKYEVTPQGGLVAQEERKKLDENSLKILREQSKFVLESSFSRLISFIYKKYPEMKINSVFSG